MSSALLKKSIALQLTPRRRRYGLVFLALFIIYSALALLAVPGLVASQAQKFVQEKLHLELGIGKVEFNPWFLAVRIEGLALKEPGATGETLVSARSVYVNAQLWSSLWIRGASLDELDLQEPYVNARIRKDGSVNLAQLVPPSDTNDNNSESHWRIGTLGVHGARIDFHDDSRATPFETRFASLNLALSNLSSNPGKEGGYTLHAETGEGEALDWQGTLAIKPVRSKGKLKIAGLKATTLWRYFQNQSPVIVEEGRIDIGADYDFSAGEKVAFALTQGRVVIDGLALYQRGAAPLSVALKQLDLNGVNLKWPEQQAGFAGLTLQDFHIADRASKADFIRFGELALANGRYTPSSEAATLDTLNLRQLVLTDRHEPALAILPELALKQLNADLAGHKAHVAQIELKKGDLAMRREKDGAINWQQRLEPFVQRLSRNTMPSGATVAKPNKVAATKAEPSAPWQATLGELDLADFRVAAEDLVPPKGVKTVLQNINFRILPQQAADTAHRLEGSLDVGGGGHLDLKGSLREKPLSAEAELNLKDLKLPPFAPYFADVAHFALASGNLDVAGKFNFSQDKTTQADFNGRIAVQRFVANDQELGERFLAWNNLAIDGLNWQLAPGRLSIRDIQADKPFLRLIIGQDKTLNLSHVVVAAPAADGTPAVAAPPPAAKTPVYPLRIDRIRLKDGAMLFADFSLKPQFATGIRALNGDIRGLSSDPASRAKIALSGRVDQYGKADINGELNPLSSDLYTDIGMKFSNIELTTLTPYAAKFAGYRIDKGKLSLELNYKINNRRLEASNKMVLNQLTLGEKVDSPDATSLPVKLAIAILKDRDGMIDIDLPVSGSLDDPQFRVGLLVWQAFVNLLTKAATAPFALIANLVGGGSDMDTLDFVPGQTTLAQEGESKIGKLAQALEQRPALAVGIRSTYDPQADALAIRTGRFDAIYQPRIDGGEKPRKVLESLFKDKFGGEALAQQRALNLKPAEEADNPEALQLAVDVYLKSLRNELIRRETLQENELQQLAQRRGRLVRKQLVEVNHVDEARVFMLDPVAATANEGKVGMKVELTAQ